MNLSMIKDKPKDTKFSFIMRHAERYPIEKMERAFEALLTENGKIAATGLGEKFAYLSPVKIFHSPVDRCRQTAKAILEGIIKSNGTGDIIGDDFLLGAPYLKGHWKALAEKITEHGMENFIRLWFNGEISDELILPLKETAYMQLQGMIDQLKAGDATYINISHDWNIVLLREFFFNLRHEDIDMPGFLDGLYAYIADDELHLIYRDLEKIINLPLS